jgi:hypothetical protein
VPVGLGAERPQGPQEDRRGADAVDVVVAVHRDARPPLDVAEDRRDSLRHARQRIRGMLVRGLQPGPRGGRRAQPAAHEHLGHDVADAELTLETHDGVHAARRDVQAAQQSARTLRRAADGTAGPGAT